MGRCCSECNDYKSRSQFSRNQWQKGDGYSRCRDCVDGYHSFQCGDCYKTFRSQNELNMHMQVHRPRNVACPVCGEQRFRSGANAVQHVESGYCSGCRGKANARKQIFDFARRQQGMQPFMSNKSHPMLGYDDSYNDSSVPDFPYSCDQCHKSFRQLSQLLQHRDQKHNQHRLLHY